VDARNSTAVFLNAMNDINWWVWILQSPILSSSFCIFLFSWISC
jgi:hypothetical protein